MPAAPDAVADRDRPAVVIVRGHQANPWELGPWLEPALAERFEVSLVRSGRGWFDTSSVALASRRVLTMRDLLPRGRLGDLATRLPGDRYLGLSRALEGAQIVHAQELGYWYSVQAARLKQRLGFRLVLTIWETIPLLDAYRNIRTRGYRRETLAATDLFLAATERARSSLLLEGVEPNRIRVCPPGVATDRFHQASSASNAEPPLILSAGRLVWEKGHQDVLRAVAALRRGLISGTEPRELRVCIVGRGPEEQRLRRYADELGLADAVEFRGFVPYDEMPSLYARAAAIVLASLPVWSWEEQFGMVLAEAMAAGTPIIAATSGAIEEVTGPAARHFAPGDWPTLARLLTELTQASPPITQTRAAQERAELYSNVSAAARIVAAYEDLLGGRIG